MSLSMGGSKPEKQQPAVASSAQGDDIYPSSFCNISLERPLRPVRLIPGAELLDLSQLIAWMEKGNRTFGDSPILGYLPDAVIRDQLLDAGLIEDIPWTNKEWPWVTRLFNQGKAPAQSQHSTPTPTPAPVIEPIPKMQDQVAQTETGGALDVASASAAGAAPGASSDGFDPAELNAALRASAANTDLGASSQVAAASCLPRLPRVETPFKAGSGFGLFTSKQDEDPLVEYLCERVSTEISPEDRLALWGDYILWCGNNTELLSAGLNPNTAIGKIFATQREEDDHCAESPASMLKNALAKLGARAVIENGSPKKDLKDFLIFTNKINKSILCKGYIAWCDNDYHLLSLVYDRKSNIGKILSTYECQAQADIEKMLQVAVNAAENKQRQTYIDADSDNEITFSAFMRNRR